MSWIPYKGQSSNARLSEKDKNLYTIRAVPFSDIRSIRRHTPTLGWQYIIIVMSSGLAFPPLYFYNGGMREFIATIKQHVFLVRSAEDSNIFLVNDFQNPLQRTLSSLELPMAVPVANVHSPTVGANESFSSAELERGGPDNKNSGNLQQYGRQRQKLHDPARDLSIQVLEKFSLVTRFARETTSQLFRETHLDASTPNDERKPGQFSPVYHHVTASNDSPKVPDEVSVPSDPVEFDKLSLVWGKPRQPPLGKEEVRYSGFLVHLVDILTKSHRNDLELRLEVLPQHCYARLLTVSYFST
ncbi:tbc1 domain family member 17 [Phtheirospermum japonicum]|uniref:Tbc1 domain family member 17 n=1 Tax=Phtheirospermum japonicum TaxID=374723 RepID=A0A830D5D1_9LAMI|nr:tbc1 domain family member 17 [Phtheirospermum japonicum]